MELKDFLALAHPILAVAIVFPMLGIVLNMAWQTRQRRQQIASGDKSKIPPIVGQEHLKAGRILSGSVVGVTLLGLGYAIFEHILKEDVWSKNSFQVIFIILMFVVTIASGDAVSIATCYVAWHICYPNWYWFGGSGYSRWRFSAHQ
jgi:hypothetical protein